MRTRRSMASHVTLNAPSPSTAASISVSKSSWARLFCSATSSSARSACRARSAASADPSSGSTTPRTPDIRYDVVFSTNAFA